MSHTHPACGATGNAVKMRMRGKWRWDDLEDEMKNYLTRTRRGERKRRRREHQHDTPGPERANPERAREKEKRRVDGHGTRPAEGGGRKRLNQPDTAKTYKHLSTRRSQPTWGGKNAWDRGPMGISWWDHKKLKQDSVPKPRGRAIVPQQARVQVSHKGIKRLSDSIELGAQYVWPHQIPKRPHLQEKDMPVACSRTCHVELRTHKLQWQKRSFWLFRTISRWERSKSLGSLGRPEPREFSKKVQNRKADCCTLLKRITKLKCVNSEFRSVDIHPKQGCLNWPYGTMSESP